MDKVVIYSDGACRGNPGRGGYGVVLMSGSYRKEISKGFRRTTNNRMELLAIIIGLEALKRPCDVTIYSDSKYVIDSVEKGWVFDWVKSRFKNKKNKDLWFKYLSVSKKHNVAFVWVKGHAGNIENERCDELATLAADSQNLFVDEIFEELIEGSLDPLLANEGSTPIS